MTVLTIQDVSRRSGLSEPTLRYYEEVGLIGPIDRDASSGHRRYRNEDLDTLADGPAISFLQMAQILRDRLGPLGERAPTEEEPGDELPNLVIHNDRAKSVFGWKPRPM
jgi:MerR family transcriptional regulator, copper efflux regulator